MYFQRRASSEPVIQQLEEQLEAFCFCPNTKSPSVSLEFVYLACQIRKAVKFARGLRTDKEVDWAEESAARVDSWSRYQHFSLDFLDFPCDTNTMNIVLNALTAFTSCNLRSGCRKLSDAAMSPSLQAGVASAIRGRNRINLETNSLVHLSSNARTRSMAQIPIVKRASISAAGRDSRSNPARHRPR